MMNEEGKVQEERAVQVNDFAVDTQKEGRKRTPRRLKVLLGLSLVVTGFAGAWLPVVFAVDDKSKRVGRGRRGGFCRADPLCFHHFDQFCWSDLYRERPACRQDVFRDAGQVRAVAGSDLYGGICMDPQTFRLSFVRV